MKNILTLILALCVSAAVYGQTATDRKLDAKININIDKIDNLSKKVDSLDMVLYRSGVEIECLDKKVASIDDSYSKYSDMVSTSSAVISNELSAGTWAFAIVSIILAICGILLGSYINRKEKQVKKLADKVSEKEKEVFELSEIVNAQRDEVVELNNKIQSDMSGLYKKLKQEETDYILNRLIAVPRDIGNLDDLLLSRELQEADYIKLLVAYNNLVKNGEDELRSGMWSTTGHTYLLIFFQHFLGLAVNEGVLRDKVIAFFETGCRCAFKNDIEKSTEDIVIAIAEWNEREKIDILTEYIKAILKTKNNYQLVYDIIVKTLNDKDLIAKVWSQFIAEKVVAENLGLAIKDFYKDDAALSTKIDSDIALLKEPEQITANE